MKRNFAIGFLAIAIAVSGALAGGRLGSVQAATGGNAVINWNRILLTTLATAAVPAPPGTRLGAIVQAAVFDAVNGIEPQYTSIHVAPAAPRGASRDAAAAGAAHTGLVAMFPLQKGNLDADLAASIAAIHLGEDASPTAIADGLAWGNSVAGQILAWRATDGFNTVLPPYVPGTAPGDWQPTPGGTGDPKFRTLAITTPFALTSPSQFRPAGPPALTSELYARDLAEVTAFGNTTSAVRTATQTETAIFWQVDTVTDIWDRVADTLAVQHHYGLLRSARLLAFVNVALADAAISVWDAKNKFNFWRPVTAIGQADWTPLLVTPYFQEYPSGHSGASSAAAMVLASYFGNHTEFTVTSNGLPHVERSFTTFSSAIAQVADARVFAGFHFRFSCNDASAMGAQVANYAKDTLMKPIKDGHEGTGDDGGQR
jgi:membrane-associated phospholipid phosphatase